MFNYLSFINFILQFLVLQHTTQTSMPPAGFEPATSASDQLLTLALDRSATGIGWDSIPGLSST